MLGLVVSTESGKVFPLSDGRVLQTQRRRKPSWRGGICLILGFEILPLPLAHADHGTPTVTVPAGCGSAEEFQSEVERRLGVGARVPLRFLGIVPDPSGGFRLQLQVGGELRELRDADCLQLFRAAVVVAVAGTLSESPERNQGNQAPKELPLQDADKARATERSPTQDPTTMAPPSDVPTAAVSGPTTVTELPTAGAGPSTPVSPSAPQQPDAPSSEDVRRRDPARDPVRMKNLKPELDVLVGAGFNIGLQPGASLAFELEAKALWRRFGVALAGRYLVSSSAQDERGRGVAIDTWGGQLTGILRPTSEWDVRLGAAGYALSGRGLGAPSWSADVAYALGPSAGISYVPLRRERMSLSFGGDIHWNVTPPSFEILNYGRVFSASLFDVSVFLRIGPRLH